MATQVQKKSLLLIDFDSTFITAETFEVLASLLPNKDEITPKIESLTKLAMNGELSFKEALRMRLAYLKLNKSHIEACIKLLQQKVSPSIMQYRSFFERNAPYIHIVSGGFAEIIIPIVQSFGIPAKQVHANRLRFDFDYNVVGVDEHNPLSDDLGKVIITREIINSCTEKTGISDLYVLGDGFTDVEIKTKASTISPPIRLPVHFIAFTETVTRSNVIKMADCVAKDFGEVINFLPDTLKIDTLESSKESIKVLLLENIHENAVNKFKENGKQIGKRYEVTSLKGALNEDELIKALAGVHLLGIRSKTKVSQRVLEHPNASSLMAIGAYCIGTNQIDKETSKIKGIAVFNAPFSNTRSVVEMAIGELIMLSRSIYEKSVMMHKGSWLKTADGSYEIRGKTLGIIGYGNIGSQLSVLAEGLGLKVIYFDKIEKLPLGNAKACATLKELLAQSDFVSLHVDGNTNNTKLIDENAINQMKDGAILINLSRGHVVDLEALEGALKNNKIKGCALDVFPDEPENNQEPFHHALCKYDNVILTPHIGGSTLEAQLHISDFVTSRLSDYADNGTTQLSLNFPNISLPTLSNLHRLIHIHQNRPGILAKINSVLAEASINIEGQYLKTNEDIGYVITDINAAYSDQEGLLSKLEAIKHTIKVRLVY